MSFESDIFLPLMPDTVTIHRYTGSDFYGKPSFSTSAVSVRARVQTDGKDHRGMDGEDVETIGSIWLASTSVFSPKDQVTLSDGSKVMIIKASDVGDSDGVHHNKFTIGRGR